MIARMHSDLLFGPGVLAETIAHFELEAAKVGTDAAWREAYDQTKGIDYLWIVYRHRLGNSTTGVFESIALSNQLGRLMRGLDEYDHDTGRAAKVRADAKSAWEEVFLNRPRAA